MSILRDNKALLDCFQEAVAGDDPKALSKDVQDLMLADLEQKLLEVIQESKKVMRASKRHVMTTQDLTLAMQKLSIPDTYGYPSSTPFLMNHKITHENQNIWFHKPQTVNLRELVTRQQP